MRAYIFWTVFFLTFQWLCRTVVADVMGYMMEPNKTLQLTEANLKILSFRIIPDWVDMTLEYSQPAGVAEAQWFGIGFGQDHMACTYAITFEPLVDESGIIIDVDATERLLGNHEPGVELQPSLAYLETWIDQDPSVVIRIRLIRPRVVPNISVSINPQNTSNSCNDTAHYEFPLASQNISIIYAKGVGGSYNISYHTEPNRHWGSIPLVTIVSKSEAEFNQSNATTTTNVTVIESCPATLSLLNQTYAQRFDQPNVARVCETCVGTNDSVCTSLGNETTTCGCSNMDLIDTSLLFLIDGAGNQTDEEWKQFNWKILDGFVNSIIGDNTTSGLEVNVLVYGGIQNALQVQRLDWRYLNYLSSGDPIPLDERQYSNLCNATRIAFDHLNNSNRTQKILVTIPWQTPDDELECIICGENCSLSSINSYAAKIFDKVDLSIFDLISGGYSNCTYLYENVSETNVHRLQEWSYVLAGISDFICTLTPKLEPITTTNAPNATNGPTLPLQLFMTSVWSAEILFSNFSSSIEFLIEASYEAATNYAVESEDNFTVKILSINTTNDTLSEIENSIHTVLIDAVVLTETTQIKNLLTNVSKTELFNTYLNFTFSLFFRDDTILLTVYKVDGQLVNITQTPQPTELTSTNIPDTTRVPAPGSNASKDDDDDDEALPWMITTIILAIILFCLLMIGCLAMLKRNMRNEKNETAGGGGERNKEQGEETPMIVTSGEKQARDKP